MKYKTFKAISENLQKLAPIKNKAALLAAIPAIVEATEKITAMRKVIRSIGETLEEINHAASKYALDHVDSVFVNGLVTDGKGVRHGDVDVDGIIFHFSQGYGKLVRSDGDNLSQEFLQGLPKKWTKGKVELDQTAISRLGVTPEELAEAGLVKSDNNVWSLPVQAEVTAE